MRNAPGVRPGAECGRKAPPAARLGVEIGARASDSDDGSMN